MIKRINAISVRTKLIFVVEIIVIGSMFISGCLVYRNIQELNREALKNKLIAIASSTSAGVDGEQIKKIQNIEDTQTAEYAQLSKLIKGIMENNENIDDIYIMIKSRQENIWQFIFSTYTQDTDLNENGIIEENEKGVNFKKDFDVTKFPQMKKAFEKKIADEEIFCDSWGCWLSGYAPILDSDGQAIAIVGVDISAQEALLYERKIKLSLFLFLGFMAFFIPILLFIYLKRITAPISIITQSIDKLNDDLSIRIKLKNRDEFGIIANSFDEMAEKLEHTIKNIESEVSERTKEIAEEKNKNDLILKSIGDGVFVVDKKMKTIMFNKMAEKITGFKQDEVIGKRINGIFKLINPTTGDNKDTCLIEDVFKTGKIQKGNNTTILITKNGHPIPIAKSASPLKNKDSEIIGCVVIFRDVTHEYSVDKAKTEFVSLASHQLRTPLSSISWYTELLLAGDVGKISESQKEYLDQIYKGNQRMIDLVNSLLNVSRLEMGTFIIEPKKIDILELADDVLNELTPKGKERNIEIRKDYDHQIPQIKADPKLVRIIFQNLLSNAIKYNKINGEVELKIKKDSKNIQIEVRDSGLGIPKKQQINIFSKFFRADNVRQTETEGTGLGLYLVKTIIEQVHGKIKFESKEKFGTTFFVTLPLAGMKAKKGTREIINVKI